MLKHGRAGVPMEVMGLMLGEFVDEFTIHVFDVFAMPQSGTGVSVEAVDDVFQTKMMDMLRQTGRDQMVVGWYHSHPGFGCWLSSVDVNTQQSFEQLNKRAVAVVIDPIQSVKGKVVIDAFRTIDTTTLMMGQEPRQSTSNVGHLNKPSIQALIHGLNRHYYSLNIDYHKTSYETNMLLNLHKKNWQSGLKLIDYDHKECENLQNTQQMVKIAKLYHQRVQEEKELTEDQLKTRYVGKQDPKKHLSIPSSSFLHAMTNPLSKRRKLDSNTTESSINRKLLDFDFEKICSITLNSNNIYCCLKCGKFFNGRSISSPAYNHSIVNPGHSIYLNLSSHKVYELPEDKQWDNANSIQDIIEYLDPKYTKRDIELLPRISFDLNDKKYLVGYIGLNNIKHNDYANVVIHLLAHIQPIRDFYLLFDNNDSMASPLNNKLSLLIKKVWSPHLFKSHVAPYEFLNCVSEISKKKFTIDGKSISPKMFLTWLLNSLHSQLIKKERAKSSELSDALQGRIKISTIPIVSQEIDSRIEYTTIENKAKEVISKFWMNSYLHVDLQDLLQKYNGVKQTQVGSKEVKTYTLLDPLPPYLIISYEKSDDKRSCVVKFNPDSLDMGRYLYPVKDDIKYRLVSTIKKDDSNWAISLRMNNDSWVSIKDLEVKSQSQELLFLDDNYIQVWQMI
ncbi:RPN11 [[Candida] subhashii]|uniref:RPN11 n=1 Tax=[Candida] subhashii TaxID=561895 RepID=A0A8J5UVE8_9ASCO|nr:RPN11 [[Candida] subhashii]KAG7662195.1 RPN11 [[Candida] subhashii]